VTVNDRFRRVLKYDPRQNFSKILPAYREAWTVNGQTSLPYRYHPEATLPSVYGYLSTWMPESYWSSPIRITTRMVDLPGGEVWRGEPAIIHRSISLIPK
jgi:hypothetical protein